MAARQLPDLDDQPLNRVAFLMSHVGRIRATNEDACALSSADERLTSWQGPIDCSGGWALLADGMGGHAAGEVASALAIEILRPMMPALRTDRDIAEAISTADTALYLAMERYPACHGMGTTIAGVLMADEETIIFNTGDSRIYALCGNSLRLLSNDDVVDGNMLTQCLGGAQEQIGLAPHIVRFRFQASTALLLCSDGLSDMLSDTDIARILNRRPANPAAALVDAAIEAGGHDNVSVIVIDRLPECQPEH